MMSKSHLRSTALPRRRTNRLTKRLAIGVLASAALASVPATASAVEITNTRSGLKADVIWGSTAINQGVFLWRDNTSLSQEFDLLSSANGYFRIRAKHSGQCLMLDYRTSYVNGTKIIQNPYCTAGYAPSEWRTGLVLGTNDVQLINRSTGKCLDADNSFGGAPAEQARLQQWDCVLTAWNWNSGNQLWRVA